jgi:predicted NUDIX family NTP pyrophosphohydrolase
MPLQSIASAGLMFRRGKEGLDVLLVHPGGPFFRNKDIGAWTIPKGEAAEGEDLWARARIEFEEELGFAPAEGWIELGSVKQKGGKTVHAWAPAICRPISNWPRIASRWNGRQDQARCSSFPKLIKRGSFRWNWRDRNQSSADSFSRSTPRCLETRRSDTDSHTRHKLTRRAERQGGILLRLATGEQPVCTIGNEI